MRDDFFDSDVIFLILIAYDLMCRFSFFKILSSLLFFIIRYDNHDKSFAVLSDESDERFIII